MRLLDLCCKAGGAAVGYHRAGFDEIVGVDIAPQPNFPFEFHRGGALPVLRHIIRYGHVFGRRFDVIHISPPCQRYSGMSACRPGLADQYPDLIAPARALLDLTGLPYVIENVPRSPLRNDLVLCGQMVGLELYRHRIFESNVPLTQPDHPEHVTPASKAGHWKPGTIMSISGHVSPMWKAREVMGGIDWMNRAELAEAIPPAYSQRIGEQLLLALDEEEAA